MKRREGMKRNVPPFKSNNEFMEEYFELLELRCKHKTSFRSSAESDLQVALPGVNPGRCQDKSSKRSLNRLRKKYQQAERCFRARVDATPEIDETWLPFIKVLRTFDLTVFEQDVLFTTLAYAYSESFRELVHSATGCTRNSISAILKLLCDSNEERIAHHANFMPSSKLISNGLLTTGSHGDSSSHSIADLLSVVPKVPLQVSNIILNTELSSNGSTTLHESTSTLDTIGLPRSKVDELKSIAEMEMCRDIAALRDNVDEPNVILIYGAAGGKLLKAAHSMIGHMGKKVLELRIPLPFRRRYERITDFKQILRFTGVLDAVPCIPVQTEMYEEEEEEYIHLLQTLSARTIPTVILVADGTPQYSDEFLRYITYPVCLPVPSIEQRESIIQECLPPESSLPRSISIPQVAAQYDESEKDLQRRIKAGCLRAATRKGGERILRLADLTLKIDMDGGMDQTAASALSYASPPLVGLDSVVLSEKLRKQVRQIINATKTSGTVFDKWGLGAKYDTGRSISALFYGPSGTGKTLTAEAIAGELGLPLRVVQISGIMGKYVGETQKHAVAVFRQAGRSGDVLVFDEADALFAVRAASEEYGSYHINSHINTLLKEMEVFRGVVILTTNHPENMDPAFERRIRWKLKFPPPDRVVQEKLWRKLMPERAPIAVDLDFGLLTKEFDFTGGLIRSTILKAAFTAASEDRAISLDDLREAARTEKLNSSCQRSACRIGFGTSA